MRRRPLLLFALLLLASVPGCSRSSPSSADTATRTQPAAARTTSPSQAAPLYIEPQAGLAWLYADVAAAQTSIDMTMYELVDTTMSGDLVQACQRGVRVRVILDQNLEKAANTPAYNQLAAAGPHCTVAWANPQFPATHQKTVLIDGKLAIVMTLNLTTRYYATSRDLALVDTDAADLQAIEATFNQDYGSTTDASYKPPTADHLIWSPTVAQPDLLGIIHGATKTLLIENEELSSATIVSALAGACKRGVQTSLAMTDTSSSYHANYTELEAAGCGVHIGANDNSTLYIHAKLIVADLGTAAAVGYLGSINFSQASMTENRELGVYVHDPSLLTQIAATITSDFNLFAPYRPSSTQSTLPARP